MREHGDSTYIAEPLLPKHARHGPPLAMLILNLLLVFCTIVVNILSSRSEWIFFISAMMGIAIVAIWTISYLIGFRTYDGLPAAIQSTFGIDSANKVTVANRYLWPMRCFYGGVLASLTGIGIFIAGVSIHVFNAILGGSALLTLGLVVMACALVAAEQRDQEDAIDGHPHG